MRFQALVLAAALAFAPGFAQPWAQVRDPVRPRETVSLKGLDLSTPNDARIAFARIKAATAKVCVQRRMPAVPHGEWRCRQRSLTRALKTLNAPLVTAAAGGRLREP